MASRLENLIEAKYKNIPFLVRSESIEGIGRKSIPHKYPQTQSQYIEDQGKNMPDFVLDIYFSGEKWQENFHDFRQAIENEDSGRLYIPTFGIINNVKAYPSNALSNHIAIGEISMTVRFSVTIEKPSPTEIDVTEEDIFEQGNITRDKLKEAFEDLYQVPNTLNNLLSGVSDIKNLISIVGVVAGFVRLAVNTIKNIASNIKNPSGLANLLLGQISPLGFLQNIALSLRNDVEDAYNIFKELIQIGSTLSNSMEDIRQDVLPQSSSYTPKTQSQIILKPINIWEEDTTERIQRNLNRLVMINTFRIIALIGMIEEASSRTYTTTIEIDQIINEINIFYSELIENDQTDIVIPEMKADIELMKGFFDDVIKIKRQNSYNVVNIFLEKSFATSLLAYELYGERINNEDTLNLLSNLLAGLNNSQPYHALEGNVNVLEI